MAVSPLDISIKIFPVFFIICSGVAIRRLNWLKPEGDSSLIKLLINVLMPCLAFTHIVNNPALQNPSNLWLPPLTGVISILLGIGIGWLAMRWFRPGAHKPRRTFALTVGIFNYGYFAIPLALALYGEHVVGVQFLFNLGVEATLWSVGVALLRNPGEANSFWENIRLSITPPVVAIFISMLLNVSGIGLHIPDAVIGASDLLGRCAIPIGVLLVGANLHDLVRDNKDWYKDWQIPLLACFLRLLLVPIIFLLICRVLPLTDELSRVCVIAASVPSGIFPIVMARIYGGDTLVALRVVISTTLVGVFTIPLWISFGEQFLSVRVP
ncbi:MAG: AEC family transporter [Opitutales bacterium]